MDTSIDDPTRLGGSAYPLSKVTKLISQETWYSWTEDIKDWAIMNSNWIGFFESLPRTADRTAAWKEKRARICQAMKITCGFNARSLITTLDDPIAIHQRLEIQFKPKGSGHLANLLKQFDLLQLSEYKDVDEYSEKFRELAYKFVRLGVSWPEPILVYRFLSGLGSAYESFHSNFLQNNKLIAEDNIPAVTLDAVMLSAQTEERSMNARRDTTGIALLAHGFGRPQGDTIVKTIDYCGHCERPHHTRTTCWKLHPNLEGPARQRIENMKKDRKPRKQESRKKQRAQNNNGSRNQTPQNRRSDPQDSNDTDSEEQRPVGTLAVQDHNQNFIFTNPGQGIPEQRLAIADDDLFSLMALSSPVRADGEAVIDVAKKYDLSKIWVMDGGANRHSTCNKALFTSGTYVEAATTPMTGIGGHKISVKGKGTIKLDINYQGQKITITLLDVLYIPDNGCNLLSETAFTDYHGAQLLGRKGGRELRIANWAITATNFNGLPIVNEWHKPTPHSLIAFTTSDEITDLWHRRMGHLGEDNIKLLKTMSTGMDLSVRVEHAYSCFCESCVKGRQKAFPHNTPIKPGEYANDLIHSDLLGPFATAYDGSRFMVTWLDDKTKSSDVDFVKQKSEVAGRFKAYVKRNNTPFLRTRRLRTDYGGEFQSHELQDFCDERSIFWEPSVPGNPQMNGAAERLGGILMMKAQPTIDSADLDHKYWPLILEAANYLRNLSPVASIGMTPYEARTGAKPDLSHLRVIGSTCWAYNRVNKKWKDRSTKCRLVGYVSDRIYKLLDPKGRIVRKATVHFREKRRRPDPDFPTLPTIPISTPTAASGENSTSTKKQTIQVVIPPRSTPPKSSHLEDPHSSLDPLQSFMALLSKHGDPYQPHEPKTYRQAIQDDYMKMEWELAMQEEYDSHITNNTWTLVDRPKGIDQHVLSGKWVYKLKRGPKGEILRYKARWVVRGFEQREGEDYTDIFATVVKPMSYKAIFAFAAAHDWEIEQMDVKTAFLEGNIDKEIYVTQPTGFESGKPGQVCKLNKALYGLKQSPRLWYFTLTAYLKTLGYDPLSSDESVLINHDTKVIIAIYVDDLLLVGPDMKAIQHLKEQLSERFDMTDLGPCNYYLGIRIIRDRPNRTIHLCQSGYIKQVLKEFKFWDGIKGVATPMETGLHLRKPADSYQCSHVDRTRYQRAIGSLMYAMLGTRPDIAFAVSMVSRYASNPDKFHWAAVIRIFKYLRGTVNFQLTYSGRLRNLIGYTDADFANDPDTRRSTSGYIFNVGSGALSWSSKRQHTVVLSTCEAEITATTEGTKEAVWLQRLLAQLDLKNPEASTSTVVLYCDNQGAIALANNAAAFHGRTKQLDTKQFWVKEKVADKSVQLEYVSTHDQVADGLTKPLPRDKFQQFRRALGLEDGDEVEIMDD